MNLDEILDGLLSLNSESEVVEFKEAGNTYSRDKLGRYFSALSNEACIKGVPRAWIVMGVNNVHKVVGTTITDDLINEFKKDISDHTSPKSTFISINRVIRDGKTVLLLEIPPAVNGMPVSWKGHRYGRDGESLAGLNEYEYEQIKSQGKRVDWSAKIVESAGLSDLSPDAISFAREQYKEKMPKLKAEIDSWSDNTFLDKAKLTIKGSITNTTLLLLGKPESDYLLSPANARITWILRGVDGIEKDYEHFDTPFLLTVKEVGAKIRNLKYRYIKGGTLFPEEVDQYDPYIIREALNNCIAHQDYTLGGKVIVVETDDGTLSFTNSGDFIPSSVEEVVTSDAPEPVYRNTFLVNAMVNLNMIDTIGSGIKRMFTIQRNKFFPLPEYEIENHKVKVQFTGKIIDTNYALTLAELPNLSLTEIILLDKVAKKKPMSNAQAKLLKAKGLIEGRRPNYYISSFVATATGDQSEYIKLRGIDDGYCQKIIMDYLALSKDGAKRESFEDVLIDKLPDILSTEQKRNKIKNSLQKLRKANKVELHGKVWKMSKKR